MPTSAKLSVLERILLVVITAELVLLLLFGMAILGPMAQEQCELHHYRANMGEEVVIDGILQNDRIRFADVTYQDGRLHYLLVNESSQLIYASSPHWIERREGDSWRLCMMLHYVDPADVGYAGAFSEEEMVMKPAETWSELRPGEYRVVSGAELASRKENGMVTEWYLEYPEGKLCFVGYFTVTEEMLNQ